MKNKNIIKMKPKKIKLFNGRWMKCIGDHGYIGAYSQKHAVELCIQAGYINMSLRELRVYWSKGCWGNPMNGVEPQVGVWVQETRHDPVKRII